VILIGTHPWEGRRFQIGDSVQPGFTIMTLPDLGQPMKVAAELSDVDDGKLATGMAATCTLDAYPHEPIACKVEELAPVARGNNMESLRRVFAVTLALAKSDPARMRPGMSVKVEVPLAKQPAGIVVPRGAITLDDNQARVRLGSGELRDVKLGACDAQRCVIETGISDGEIVLEGQ
jgi:multidrug efflux pump subunit AcrA (membrane-fusion protein)